ncbi:carbonic anhydrase, partial [Pseudomonas sp. MWU12-2115]
MSDKDKQPSAASAPGLPGAETADAALQHIVDGFLHFHHEIFPQQEELFKKLATA